MDDGRGNFNPLSEEDVKRLRIDFTTPRVFSVGEVLEIKGSRFRVKAIKPKE